MYDPQYFLSFLIDSNLTIMLSVLAYKFYAVLYFLILFISQNATHLIAYLWEFSF